MFASPYELVRSVEAIWITWFISVAIFVWITRQAIRRQPWRRLRRLNNNETGGAYTLSLVLIVPFYTLLICVIAETTLILTVKTGTIYAAYQACRAGVVWSSAASWGETQSKMRQAAVESMVPFASGTQGKGKSGTESAQARRYLDAYQEYAKTPGKRSYLAAKYRYAEKYVSISSDGPPAEWHSDLEVTIQYEFPFTTPGAGMILGKKNADGRYCLSIISKAKLQNEGPKNAQQRTGIRYASPD
ncbi:hypothetical protein LOC68_09520 [Blastopirellula sp. JC732]|uniref:Pilus assembly protein n=1 Tax=Blastopirellula sediminis TaxID=2894196 RepID=A0A9X1ML74_9BACT|nr:hypothetical protein [Blastopirellula sediminis]MCC9608587.1 hypothetical protein [Blastopirellula sediminis]MCC9628636.1 hypothetical protein [Blastopirellula sediminis]